MKHRMNLRLFVALGVALLATLPDTARAGFTLGGASDFAVLANVGNHSFQMTSDSSVTGNVGVLFSSGNNNPIQLSGGTITGNLDLSGSFSGSTGGTVTGMTTQNVAAVSNDLTSLTTLSSTLGGELGTTLPSGTSTINASSGMLDSNGNEVFTVTANNFTNFAHTVTINGTASQFVVINVTGNNNISFDAFNLTGGITSDHVLFNLLGSNQNVQVSGGHGGVIMGTILGINENFNMDNATLDGRIFGGNANNFQLVSGFHVVQPAASVPEPASAVMLSMGGIAIALVVKFRRHRAA
jgi:choice-of-anchor A domain-containing protein